MLVTAKKSPKATQFRSKKTHRKNKSAIAHTSGKKQHRNISKEIKRNDKKRISKHIPKQKHNRFDKQKYFKTLLGLRCDTEINGKLKDHPNGTKTNPENTSELYSENTRRKNIFPEFWVKFHPENPDTTKVKAKMLRIFFVNNAATVTRQHITARKKRSKNI